MRLSVTTLLIAASLALVACGGGDGSTKKETSTPTAPAARVAGCTQVALPKPKGPQNLPKPTQRLKPSPTYTVTFDTNCGSFTITLDQRKNPKTAASFASLAQKGFYDDLTFHRIVAGFVIQGGDPLGNGEGGPGYTVIEKPAKGTRYTRGVVAMAKTAAEPAGASGSQFFVVTGDDIGLPAEYAVAGRVTKGMDTVLRIGAIPAPDPVNEPRTPVVISKATLAGG